MNVLKAAEDTMALAEKRIGEGWHHSMTQTGDTGLIHLLSMRDRMRTEDMTEGKRNRWLGYMQGCIVAHSLATVEEMKEINRLYASNGK